MKLQNVFQDTIVLGFVVPLAITPLGLIYLNDHGVWNITINWKNSNCVNKTITAAQLLELFQQHASCYANQKEHFEEKRQQMMEKIKMLDASTAVSYTHLTLPTILLV